MLRNLISSHHHRRRRRRWRSARLVVVCASRVVKLKIKMHSLTPWFIFCDISHSTAQPSDCLRNIFPVLDDVKDFSLKILSFVIILLNMWNETWSTNRMHLKGAIWVCVIINQPIWARVLGWKNNSYPAWWWSCYCWERTFCSALSVYKTRVNRKKEKVRRSRNVIEGK